MRTGGLLAMFLTVALLITGCSSNATTKKDTSSGATDSGQKSAPAKPANPSEGS